MRRSAPRTKPASALCPTLAVSIARDLLHCRMGVDAIAFLSMITSSIVQKYQLQEADFDIMGTRPPKQ